MAEQRQAQPAVDRTARPFGAGPAAAMTPKDVYAIFRRHLLLMISGGVLGLIVGGVSWYLFLTYYPKYKAETYIQVLPPVEKDPMAIGGGVVNKDLQYGYRLSITNLITQQNTLMDLLSRDKVKQTEWYQHFGKSETVRFQEAFEDLRKRFSASAHRDAEFVSVAMTCGNKKEAALIVNQMVDLFITSQGVTKRKEVADRMARLEDERERVQRDLDASERALEMTRERWDLTDLEQRIFEHTITVTLNRLEIERNDLMLQLKQLESIVETLERQATGPISEQVQVEDQIEVDPVMVLLAQQVALQEARLASILTKFGENHRVVRESRELINETRKTRERRKIEIAEQTRQSNLQNSQDRLIVLTDRMEELEKLRQEAEARKRDLDLARVQYQQRMTIRDQRKDRLNDVLESISKLRMLYDAPDTPKVRFVGYAPEPLVISFPKWQVFFPGGTVLGLVIGIGLAFLIEMLNDLVRMPRDVARFLHVRLLGVIPDVDEDPLAEGVDLCHIVRLAPFSIISESYRLLRTNLKLSDSAAGASKVLLVSSGGAGDGKTSVAVNLAAAFVAENKKVLLIDANFRRPSLDSLFPRPQANDKPSSENGLDNDLEEEADAQSVFGLSTILTGLCGYQQIIRPSGIEGLDVIYAGPAPPNPAELLGGEQMEQLLRRQRESYDYIIIDSPPVLVVSDSKMLAKFVDGTVLVFNAAATHRGAALRTIRELKEVDARIIGCVLMAVKALKGGYFREQFRSYQQYQRPQLAHSL